MNFELLRRPPFRVKCEVDRCIVAWTLRPYKILSVVLFALLGTAESIAQHSTALYVVRETEFRGELVHVAWRNPHVLLTIVVRDDLGAKQPLVFLADNINNLEHGGLARDMLVTGEAVTIIGRRSGRFKDRVLAQSIRLDTGNNFVLWLGR